MKRGSVVLLRALAVASACVAAGALAQEPGPTPPAPATGRSVGGHIGVAVPLVMINEDDTNTVGDNFVIAVPIGIGFKLSEKLVLDFETIVQTPVDPSGTTSLVVDPGLVYNLGPFAAGLRVAWAINQPANVGLIPLVNKGLADLGGGVTWFVEAAFPMFIRSEPPDFTLDVVFHTGFGF
jgi:hypothetical protein